MISKLTQSKNTVGFLFRHRELLFWITALVLLYRADLNIDFSLCLLKNLGFSHCPGCGIGHAITALMHGDISASWQYHFFGIPALGILLWHIGKLIKKLQIDIKTKNNEHNI